MAISQQNGVLGRSRSPSPDPRVQDKVIKPAELYEEIIAHLWDDAPALKAASTAFRALTAPAQRHLFSHITLHSPSLLTSKTAPRLRDLLTRAPHLALHVTVLEVCGRETPAFAFHAREDALMFCLPLLRRLRALRVGYRMDLRRECLLFAPGLAHVLAAALALPALVCVEFAHLPLALAAHCKGLRALALQDPDTQDAVVQAWVEGCERAPREEGAPPTRLECLQLDYVSEEVGEGLHKAGFVLDELRTLSVRALDYCDKEYITGLGATLRECSATLEELELDEPKIHSLAYVTSFAAKDPLPWGALGALRTLRINLAFPPDDDDVDERLLAGQQLLWLEHILARLPRGAAIETLVLQDYTDFWAYATEDIYVSAWTRIVRALGRKTRFPAFRALVVDSKRSVTQKIQAQVLAPLEHDLPFAVQLGPGRLPSKIGRSFLRRIFGSDWQASDI